MYMDREMMIAACRKVLPYPVSFYDKLSDGSLWNVYDKHVIQKIPIDKRSKKAKAENDKARAEEANQMKQPKQQTEKQSQENHQITIDEYLEAMQPSKPKIIHNSEDGTWWRLNDAGEYDYISDSELYEILEASSQSYVEETTVELEEPGIQLTLRRRFPGGRK